MGVQGPGNKSDNRWLSDILKQTGVSAVGKAVENVAKAVVNQLEVPLAPSTAKPATAKGLEQLPATLVTAKAQAGKELGALRLPPSTMHQLFTQLDAVASPQDLAKFQQAHSTAVVANVRDGGYKRAMEEARNCLAACGPSLTDGQRRQVEMTLLSIASGPNNAESAAVADRQTQKMTAAMTYIRAVGDRLQKTVESNTVGNPNGFKDPLTGEHRVISAGSEADIQAGLQHAKERVAAAKIVVDNIGGEWVSSKCRTPDGA